jgi:hypothetical protein
MLASSDGLLSSGNRTSDQVAIRPYLDTGGKDLWREMARHTLSAYCLLLTREREEMAMESKSQKHLHLHHGSRSPTIATIHSSRVRYVIIITTQ